MPASICFTTSNQLPDPRWVADNGAPAECDVLPSLVGARRIAARVIAAAPRNARRPRSFSLSMTPTFSLGRWRRLVSRRCFRRESSGHLGCRFRWLSCEVEQIRIELLLMSAHQAVRRAWVYLEPGGLDQLRRSRGADREWHDLIVVAMKNERRYVHSLGVVRELALGKRLDTIVRRLEPDLHAESPELIVDTLGYFRAGPIRAVERRTQVLPELRSIRCHSGTHRIERFNWQSVRVVWRLQHAGNDRANEDGFREARRAVPTHEAHDFTAAG